MKQLLLSALLLSTAIGADTLTFNARSTDPHSELKLFKEKLHTLANHDPIVAAAIRGTDGSQKLPANANEAAMFLNSINERRAAISSKPKMDTFAESVSHARDALKRAHHQIEGIGEEEEQLLDELEREARNLRAKRQCRQTDPSIPTLDKHLKLSPSQLEANPSLNHELREAITNSQIALDDLIRELQQYGAATSPQLSTILRTLTEDDGIVAQVTNILFEIQTTLGNEDIISFQSVQSLIRNNFLGLTTLFKGAAGDASQTLIHRLIGGFESKKQPSIYAQDPTLFTVAGKIPKDTPLYDRVTTAIKALLSLLGLTTHQFGVKLSNESILRHVPDQVKPLLDLYKKPTGTSIQTLEANITHWRQGVLHRKLALLNSSGMIKTEEETHTQQEQECRELTEARFKLATDFNSRKNTLAKLRTILKRNIPEFKDPVPLDATQTIQDFIGGEDTALDSMFKDTAKKDIFSRQIRRAQSLESQAKENQEYRTILRKISDASQKHNSFMRLLERLVQEVKPDYIKLDYLQPREAWAIICNSWNTASYLTIAPEQRARLYVNGLTSLSDEMVWLDTHKFNASDFGSLKDKYILARDAIALINLGEPSDSYRFIPGFEITENQDRMDEEDFTQNTPPPPPPPAGFGAFSWDSLSTNIDRFARQNPTQRAKIMEILSTTYVEALTYLDVPVPTPSSLRDKLRTNNLY